MHNVIFVYLKSSIESDEFGIQWNQSVSDFIKGNNMLYKHRVDPIAIWNESLFDSHWTHWLQFRSWLLNIPEIIQITTEMCVCVCVSFMRIKSMDVFEQFAWEGKKTFKLLLFESSVANLPKSTPEIHSYLVFFT